MRTVKTYLTEAEAYLDLSILENNNIKGYIFNVISSTIYPIFNSTIGGIELQVNEDDFEQASKILDL